MTVVDAHHHLWDLARRPYPWLEEPALAPIHRSYTLDELAAHTRSVGVECTVLVQTIPDVDETREMLATAAGSQGLIAGVVGWVDLRDPEVEHTIASLRAVPGGDRLVGIRHQAQDEADPRWLTRPDVVRGLRVLAEAGLVFDLLVFPHQLPAATEAARQVPDGRFVLDHGGKPPIRDGRLQPWASDVAQLGAHEHVACKLSGMVTEADWDRWSAAELEPYVQALVEAFGPERLMLGSDWPVCELAGSYEQVWRTMAGLGESFADARIRGEVARHTYRLDG